MNTEMKKTVVYSTGDKILNIMKEQDMDIPELSLRCGVREDVLMDILAGIREADISTLCKIADGLEICVRSFALMKKAMSFRWKKISLQSSL